MIDQIVREKFITIYVDHQLDFGSLIGSYACTHKVGQFAFKQGPVSFAFQLGKTLLFKNL